ncbi:MAG: asparaginase [Bauldia sp.]
MTGPTEAAGNPILVEVTRGPLVESRHAGALAVVDEAGSTVFALGDVARLVFPRSAVKPIQALPLVETGAADACGFGPEHLALAQASHSGSEAHTAVVRDMLARAGASPADLECGAHPPFDEAARAALARSGEEPGPLHNNCSGKHAGFIAVARHLGVPVAGYVAPGHPVQQRVTAALAALTGSSLGEDVRGTDGCSIPAYAVPLDRLAFGFARLASGKGMEAARAAAARRLLTAATAHPHLVAGEGRFDTAAMRALGGRALVKSGAEGVLCAAVPERRLGLAVKADDGAGRAAEAIMAATLAALLALGDTEREALGRLVVAPVRSRRRDVVGEVRPSEVLRGALPAVRS